ncbi:MAG: TROVE domain-containing protein, partial [Bacteroidota bacterium]
KRIIKLIRKADPVFVAKLAIYAREQMHLRSIPLVLLVELAKVHHGTSLVKNATQRVVQRADEICELLAYYQLTNRRSGTKKLNRLSKQLQKGLGMAFNKFDEYQFAKYNRGAEVKLKDALFLIHPKADNDAQQALFNKIANDQLEVPYTWEVELSRLGQIAYDDESQKREAFQAKWEELIFSNRLGYMAMMRNLRNILLAGVGAKAIRKVANFLADAGQVSRSRQLPFRFLSAYRELEILDLSFTSYLMDALESAVATSVQNIKGFGLETRVLIAADVSGSMYHCISPKSKIRCFDIGLLLAMLLRNRSENVKTGIFGSTWKSVNLPKSGILANTMELNRIEGSVGYATNGHLVIKELYEKHQVMDKVMIFSDLQLWDSGNGGNSLQQEWKRYKREVAPGARLYLFDLLGYGQSPLNLETNDVYLIAGWSDKIFDVLEAVENGSKALSKIKRIGLTY